MHVPYRKMHGTGNVILIVDRRDDNLPPPLPQALRELGDEQSGPGFDQLMWITSATDGKSAASYRVFNADGSEVEQCGNGVRCVVRYLTNDSRQETHMTLQSPAGAVAASIGPGGLVSVSMGTARFRPEDIPFCADEEADRYPLDVNGEAIEVSAVSMGNPHCVLQVEDIVNAPVDRFGPVIEHHKLFPERTNVGFMQIVSRQDIHLRVHERGVGETAACGTGACAAVAVGQRLGLLDDDVAVRLPGGQVMVSLRRGDRALWLTGNAERISDGIIELKE